jgi:hypothetical protein
MDSHQVGILEKVFFGEEGKIVYQRIGDKNQAIHSNINSEDVWGLRNGEHLEITGSHRLTPEIASVVQNFGLDFIEISGMRNSNASNLKPHIIFYDDPTTVLETFTRLINENQLQLFSDKEEYPFRAVGWTESNSNNERIAMRSYWPSFRKNQNKTYYDHQFLRDYLEIFPARRQIITLEPIQDSLIKGFLKCLEILNKKNETDAYFTKNTFLNLLKVSDELEYKTLRANLYNWSYLILQGVDTYQNVRDYFVVLLGKMYPDENLEFESYSPLANVDPEKYAANGELVLKK